MITTILLTFHIILSIIIICLILFHKGKGSEIGASFGGNQDSILSNQTSNLIIKKIIILIAIVIAINMLSINYINKTENNTKVQKTILNLEDNLIPGINKKK